MEAIALKIPTPNNKNTLLNIHLTNIDSPKYKINFLFAFIIVYNIKIRQVKVPTLFLVLFHRFKCINHVYVF